MPSPKELKNLFENAVGDARHLYNKDGEVRVGALIVPTYWVDEKDKKAETLHTRLREFGRSSDTSVQFSWEVDAGGVHSRTTFFYFANVS